MEPFTKVDNNLYDWLNSKIGELTKRELGVCLVIIRNTAGFHRRSHKLSNKFIANASGLNRSGVGAAIRSLQEKGYIEVVKKGQTNWIAMTPPAEEIASWSTEAKSASPENNRSQNGSSTEAKTAPVLRPNRLQTEAELAHKKERKKEREKESFKESCIVTTGLAPWLLQ